MKRTLVKLKNTPLISFILTHKKYAPIIFFVGGFLFDSLTLGRIDSMSDLLMLCFHMTALSGVIYLYSLAADEAWKGTLLDRIIMYSPLAIQFFFGGLASAYVIYFSRSVSLSKTGSFLVILIALLILNEFIDKRIANKYLQFSIYFFISFIFFAFMVPVVINSTGHFIFILSGLISLGSTLALIRVIYRKSASTREEVHLGKLIGIIVAIYIFINACYVFKLIPPVPLALQTGIVAHNIEVKNNKYEITFEASNPLIFWRTYDSKFTHTPDKPVYIFSSIFAPTALEKSIIHKWQWFSEKKDDWVVMDNISFDIKGGRDDGFRGYTYKNNVKPGLWRVEVLTQEELILGVIDFEIVTGNDDEPIELTNKLF